MDINFSDADNQFRQEVKDYLENKYPKHVKEKQNNGEQLTKQDMIDYHKSLYEQGWAGYNWPVEYGGTGWSPTQIYIFQEELGYANTPTILPFGLNMVGPVIYTFGNEEQKKKFLPDILEFNTWWCQGYSEPGSGSDLASLKTKAVRDGDHYIVNGSKTWTTLAQNADWIFCLVRTETTQKKQEGISFLLIDMKTEGIEVKPIITIDGDHEVNSVFFTDVKVPAENLIGEEGKGWTYAKFLLAHERFGIAGVPNQKYSLKLLKERTKDFADDDLKKKIADYEIELSALEFTELRTLAALANGGHPGAESSIIKIKGTELQQRLTEMYVEAAGQYILPYEGPEGFNSNNTPASNVSDFSSQAVSRYLNFRKTSIYGGSNEIQKNIIAKAILGV
ncbi:MAG: acyl-CoA dehydrogenase [Gammaproteobacteria bacterium]|jgi:alkylation response protein AidB-like acyl-CoA dehydrogenase|nr:MAG: pimeloyl-CoA dehydrogenase large subunit [Gammaproteobacteria bacterium TMED104]GIR07175.1 MAG: acyl-CoA dehydrogenase [Gammaproteobacteria bacterium]|tara:strand:- start:138 stop:1313 length:1176 start_codon:yes stop_codon:yes gene_type:complete